MENFNERPPPTEEAINKAMAEIEAHEDFKKFKEFYPDINFAEELTGNPDLCEHLKRSIS
jgi:hypothetical protein